MSKIKMIVSHYERNLEWLDKIDKNIEIIVYNKGKEKNENYIELPNVGREPHTYFQYIIDNYDNLSDWVIFSQDGPHEHVKNWESIINSSPSEWKRLSAYSLNDSYFFSDLGIIPCNSTGLPTHWEALPVSEIWEEIFNTKFPGMIYFIPTCHIITTRENIRSKPIEFYKKSNEILMNNQKSPWVFERLMAYIFTKN